MIEKFLHLSTDWRKSLISVFLVLLVLGVYLDFFGNEKSAEKAAEQLSLNGLIPKGHELLVLDLKNADSLSILIDEFAVVTLYTDNLSKPLVTGLKVIRAPKNPQEFVAIVPKHAVARFVPQNQNLTAVVEIDDQETGTVFVRQKAKTKRAILIGTETI
ncbi:MAG: hypothetical protein HRT45_11130 [Bdellovibrionales bacterium]|nr:hypothetical protein [Bdellovibrionales bacterium]